MGAGFEHSAIACAGYEENVKFHAFRSRMAERRTVSFASIRIGDDLQWGRNQYEGNDQACNFSLDSHCLRHSDRRLCLQSFQGTAELRACGALCGAASNRDDRAVDVERSSGAAAFCKALGVRD